MSQVELRNPRARFRQESRTWGRDSSEEICYPTEERTFQYCAGKEASEALGAAGLTAVHTAESQTWHEAAEAGLPLSKRQEEGLLSKGARKLGVCLKSYAVLFSRAHQHLTRTRGWAQRLPPSSMIPASPQNTYHLHVCTVCTCTWVCMHMHMCARLCMRVMCPMRN